ACFLLLPEQLFRQRNERLATFFEVLELVVAGRCRGEQDGVEAVLAVGQGRHGGGEVGGFQNLDLGGGGVGGGGEAIAGHRQGDQQGDATQGQQFGQLGIILVALVAAGDQGDPLLGIGSECSLGGLRRGRDRIVDEQLAADLVLLEPVRQRLEFGDALDDAIQRRARREGQLGGEAGVIEVVHAL